MDEIEQIIAAWKSGAVVQYLVTRGYDDYWTDYTRIEPPTTQNGRLAWRVKPTTGD